MLGRCGRGERLIFDAWFLTNNKRSGFSAHVIQTPKAAMNPPTMMKGRRRPQYFAYLSGSRSLHVPMNGLE